MDKPLDNAKPNPENEKRDTFGDESKWLVETEDIGKRVGKMQNSESEMTSIGDAWLEADGSITMRLRSTSDGMPLDALLNYKTSDKDFKNVMEHLGGLKPGEVKSVPPWKDND